MAAEQEPGPIRVEALAELQAMAERACKYYPSFMNRLTMALFSCVPMPVSPPRRLSPR